MVRRGSLLSAPAVAQVERFHQAFRCDQAGSGPAQADAGDKLFRAHSERQRQPAAEAAHGVHTDGRFRWQPPRRGIRSARGQSNRCGKRHGHPAAEARKARCTLGPGHHEGRSRHFEIERDRGRAGILDHVVPAPPTVAIARARQFFRDVLSQIATLPGVLAAGATMAPPGYVDSTGSDWVDHMPAQLDPTAPAVILSIVAPGTFGALGIPLKTGRDFSDSDTVDRPFVAVVNEALVRKSFANQNPLGRTIFCPFDSFNGMTIIGVVGDVRQRGPEREPMPECYMTYGQHAFNGATLSVVVRTARDPNTLADTVRRLARERSPDVPMKFTTMEAILSESVAAPRFRTLLFGVFAVLAVCLAMAGVYSVMAYAVGQRSNEIGLRIALGASTGSVLGLILGQGVILTAIGLTLGLAGAIASARLLTTMLFQVRPSDPMVYLAVAVLLAVVALLASYVPASRASRIDPLAALRQE